MQPFYCNPLLNVIRVSSCLLKLEFEFELELKLEFEFELEFELSPQEDEFFSPDVECPTLEPAELLPRQCGQTSAGSKRIVNGELCQDCQEKRSRCLGHILMQKQT